MQRNELLNNVLAVMTRSLLQYMANTWPWADGASDGLRTTIEETVAAQGERIQKLASLLESRRWPVDFGNFPDFTDLHFLSIRFLLPHLVKSERTIVAEIAGARDACQDDAEGAALLDELLLAERAVLDKLVELSAPAPEASATSQTAHSAA